MHQENPNTVAFLPMKTVCKVQWLVALLMASAPMWAQDEEDPGFPTGGDPGVPIDGYMVPFAIVAVLLAFYVYKAWEGSDKKAC